MGGQQRTEYSRDLGTVIQAIRAELESVDLERRKKGLPALFRIGQVSVELKFVVREVSQDGFGVDLKVIGFEDKEEYESERVHSVTIQMEALTEKPRGGELEIPIGSLAKRSQGKGKTK